MKKVRFGVVGVGAMGAYHARQLADGNIQRAELTAVCDIAPDRIRRFPSVKGFVRGDDLIRSGLVDAVLIATPHYNHTTIGIDALKTGLHVLVEKPISVHKADAERLIAAHTNPGQVFAAMFNQRTDPRYIRIRQLVQAGELGELRRVHWTITDWFRTEAYYASSGWRATWAGEGGGVLLNQAAHNLDLFQWMFGMPARVRATCQLGRYHNIEVEDDVIANLDYADGATGQFVTSTGEAPGTNRLEVTGERGRLVLEADRLELVRNDVPMTEFNRQTDKSYAQPAQTRQEIRFENRGGQHVALLQNFVDAIVDGAPLIAPAEEGIHSVELANAMLLSSLTGQAVTLPLDGAAYEARLKTLIAGSRFAKPVVKKQDGEVAPYLAKEKS